MGKWDAQTFNMTTTNKIFFFFGKNCEEHHDNSDRQHADSYDDLHPVSDMIVRTYINYGAWNVDVESCKSKPLTPRVRRGG